jgi:hypothetical protein
VFELKVGFLQNSNEQTQISCPAVLCLRIRLFEPRTEGVFVFPHSTFVVQDHLECEAFQRNVQDLGSAIGLLVVETQKIAFHLQENHSYT